MRRNTPTLAWISLLLALLLNPLWAQKAQTDHPIQARLVSDVSAFAPGKSFWVALHLTMEPGWHTYSNPPGESGYPTALDWNLPEGFVAGEIQWPKPEAFLFEESISYGYSNEVFLPVLITPPDDFPVGEELVLKAQANWLACEVMCIPGGSALVLTLSSATTPVASGALSDAPQEESMTVFQALIFAFVGGLILNLMPCVFPVLGLKVLGFIKQADEQAYKIKLHGLAFAAGVIAFFWVLVGALLALRATGESMGWGFQLQSPWFLVLLSGILFLMGLNFAGVFEWGASLSRAGGRLDTHSGYSGSFFSGALATLVATPCTAPFMGSAIGFALAQSAWDVSFVFTSLALGMATPVLLLSFFPRWIRLLPKPGAWMSSFKQFMAFPLFATVIWLLWVFGQQTDVHKLTQLSFGLLFLSISAWIYGRWCSWESPAPTKKKAFIWVVLFFAAGLVQSLGAAKKVEVNDYGINWVPFSEEAKDAFRAQGKGVFIDFTAAWCLTCQTNKKVAISDPAVLKRFNELNIVMMEADWTRHDPVITKALAAFGRSGVPFYVLYLPEQGTDPIFFPEILLPEIILEKLALYEKRVKAH
tara:strand:+ start:14925 stop:16691 length:1767 start_codon:yes stop_codon:yes gene_type:complete